MTALKWLNWLMEEEDGEEPLCVECLREGVLTDGSRVLDDNGDEVTLCDFHYEKEGK